MLTRRGFICGLTGVLAAPAIVRATSLMPVVPFERWLPGPTITGRFVGYDGTFDYVGSELSEITRKAFIPLIVQQYREDPLLAWLV